MSVYEGGSTLYKYRASYEDSAGTFAGWFLVVALSPSAGLEAAKDRIEQLFGSEANVAVTLQTVTLDPAVLTNV